MRMCPVCKHKLKFIELWKADDGSIQAYYECLNCDYDKNFTREDD